MNFSRENGRSRVHDLDEAFAEAENIEHASLPSGLAVVRRATLGVISLGFGGPLGPEAPLIEIATQMSARMASILRIAKKDAVQISVAGSLGALFGAPLALANQETSETAKVPSRIQKLRLLGPEILAGVVAFTVFSKLLPGDGFHRFHGDITTQDFGPGLTALWLVIAAFLASAVALSAQMMLPHARSLVTTHIPGGSIGAGLSSGAVLGGVAINNPIVLFSGHHEIQQLLDDKHETTLLIKIGLLKLLVLVACLAGGWFGGQIFPMAFIGVAISLSLGQLVGSTATLALAAVGFVSAVTVGVRKPVLSLLIGVLFFPAQTWLPMLLAIAVAHAITSNFALETAH
jgi:H+/Cl- antiporter ClcA